MTLIHRLEALKARYAKLKKQHRKRNNIHREMVMILCKILKREMRHARD